MTTTLSTAGASVLAHGVHYGLVLGGLVGVALLLGPQLLARQRVRRSLPAHLPADAHQRRVALLREGLATGTLTRSPADVLLLDPGPRDIAVAGSRTALPLAVVASAAAAGIHAAVVPGHLDDGVAVGAFFLTCALAQLAWAARLLRGATPSLLVVGLLGNAGVLVLWLGSRTVGLDGLPHGSGAFGPWDLTCAAFELTVVGVCAHRITHRATREAPAPWWAWTSPVHGLLVTAVLALGVLSLSGAHA